MSEKSAGAKFTFSEEADTMTLRISLKRSFFTWLFLSLWLCIWLLWGIEVFVKILDFQASSAVIISVLKALGLWTFHGWLSLYLWLCIAKDDEVITITPSALSIKYESFGFGRTKHYDVSEVHNLRTSPPMFNPSDFRKYKLRLVINNGQIAFDYGYSTVKFAARVGEDVAEKILEKITTRFPRLLEPAEK